MVDYDNFYVGTIPSQQAITHEVNRMISLVFQINPNATMINIRLYGGWLEEGLLTNRGSELQTALGNTVFPMRHPTRNAIVRGSVVLVTRLEAVPELEWRHTYRSRLGLPRLQLVETPRPTGCAREDSCPVDLVQRMSRRRVRECHVDGCEVTNEAAFRLREQKMVDSMICCDLLAFASRGADVVVLSDDLDVLPAVAMGSKVGPGQVLLVRSGAESESLYAEELESIGVTASTWAAA